MNLKSWYEARGGLLLYFVAPGEVEHRVMGKEGGAQRLRKRYTFPPSANWSACHSATHTYIP